MVQVRHSVAADAQYRLEFSGENVPASAPLRPLHPYELLTSLSVATAPRSASQRCASQVRLSTSTVWCAPLTVPGHIPSRVEERRRQLEETYLRALELAAEASLRIGGGELATAERSARSLSKPCTLPRERIPVSHGGFGFPGQPGRGTARLQPVAHAPPRGIRHNAVPRDQRASQEAARIGTYNPEWRDGG